MIVAQAHVVVIKGQVFERALFIVDEDLLSRHGFFKLLHGRIVILDIEETEAQIICRGCFGLPLNRCFLEVVDRSGGVAHPAINNSQVEKGLVANDRCIGHGVISLEFERCFEVHDRFFVVFVAPDRRIRLPTIKQDIRLKRIFQLIIYRMGLLGRRHVLFSDVKVLQSLVKLTQCMVALPSKIVVHAQP